MRINTLKFNVGKLLVLLALAFIINSCDFASGYGLEEIKLNNGNRIYIKHVERGFSYMATIVSTDNNYCAEPNKRTEYVFTESVTKRYLLDGDVLYLLIDLQTERLESKKLEQGVFPITVKLLDLKSSEASEIINRNSGKVANLNAALNKDLRCWF